MCLPRQGLRCAHWASVSAAAWRPAALYWLAVSRSRPVLLSRWAKLFRSRLERLSHWARLHFAEWENATVLRLAQNSGARRAAALPPGEFRLSLRHRRHERHWRHQQRRQQCLQQPERLELGLGQELAQGPAQ